MSHPLRRAMALVPFLGLTARRSVAATEASPLALDPALLIGDAAPPGAVASLPAGATPPAPAAETPPATPAASAAPGGAEAEGTQQPEAGKPKKAEGETDDADQEDETDREEMRGGTPIAQARARERARNLAILSHPKAAANLPLALRLMGSSMGRHEACAILAESPAASADQGELSRAMAGFADLRPGADAPPAAQGQAAISASWDTAFARTRGLTPR